MQMIVYNWQCLESLVLLLPVLPRCTARGFRLIRVCAPRLRAVLQLVFCVKLTEIEGLCEEDWGVEMWSHVCKPWILVRHT